MAVARVSDEHALARLAADVANGNGPNDIVAAIRAGTDDPLGAEFCRLRPPAQRRESGATYTPRVIVDAILKACQRLSGGPARIIDPGAGSGRFTLAAAAMFPSAEIVAIELDPLAALLLRANVVAAGIEDRVRVIEGSFLDLVLEPVEGSTAFIGNPPYVRHHRIAPSTKAAYALRMSAFGIVASRLAGLHLHFLAKAAESARDGDAVCFITASEWLDVGYGSAARSLFTGRFGLVRLDILEPTVLAFDDAMTSAAIVSAIAGYQPAFVPIRRHERLSSLSLSGGRAVPVSRLRNLDRWSGLGKTHSSLRGLARLGDYFRVSRGQVTGSNAAVNSVKRLNNDAAAKAGVWRREFGEVSIVPTAVLAGVFYPLKVGEAQAVGLSIIWSHALHHLRTFIESTKN